MYGKGATSARRVFSARRAGESGAAAVEFALVLPILVMLLFGVTSVGLTYSDHLSITNAVRESARLGAAIDYAPGPNAWADSVQLRVQQVYFNAGSTLATNQICVQLLDSGGVSRATPTTQGADCGSAPSSPSVVPAGSCIVKVWVKKPAKISLVVAPDYDFSIGARSVSYYGRTTGSCTAS